MGNRVSSASNSLQSRSPTSRASRHGSGLLQRVNEAAQQDPNVRVVKQEVFNAQCVHVETGPNAGIKGRGALVLTKDYLWFSVGKPRRDLFIQLLDINDVRTTQSLVTNVGKNIKGPLLSVAFEDPSARSANHAHFRLRGVVECEEWAEGVAGEINECRRRLSQSPQQTNQMEMLD